MKLSISYIFNDQQNRQVYSSCISIAVNQLRTSVYSMGWFGNTCNSECEGRRCVCKDAQDSTYLDKSHIKYLPTENPISDDNDDNKDKYF